MRSQVFYPSFLWNDSVVAQDSSRIEEREEGYFIQLDMPGVKKDGLIITQENNRLYVEGKRPGRREIKRAYSLPDDVDSDKIQAQLSDGVLELSLPKKEKLKPKQIEVKESKESFFKEIPEACGQ